MSEVSPWSVIQSIAERRIEESMAKGDFDDLPGRGKPLELEDDSHVPPELRMAYQVLRNAGCVPCLVSTSDAAVEALRRDHLRLLLPAIINHICQPRLA